MRAFDYARPTSLDEAVRLLARDPGSTRILSGGTDLVVGLRDATVTPSLVVDVKRARGMEPGVTVAADRVVIGATTSMARLVDHPVIRRSFPALVDAMNIVGSIQIRNRATLAGNICTASPAADTVLPMLVHDARVRLVGPHGDRYRPLREFIVGPRRTDLRPGEVLTAIEMPLPQPPFGTAFARMTRRRGVDLATVNLCCSVDGTARFAYGAVGPRAFLVTDDSGVLVDPGSSDQDRDAALDRLIAQAAPISDIRGSREYRLAMLRVLSRRALAVALRRRDTPEAATEALS